MTGNRFCRCFPKVLKKPIQLFLLRSHLFLVRRLKKKLNHRFRLFLSLFLFSSSGCGAIFPSTPMSPCKNSLSRIEDSSSSLCCFSQTEGGITPIVRFINFTFFSKKGLCDSGLKAKSTTFVRNITTIRLRSQFVILKMNRQKTANWSQIATSWLS